MIRIVLFRTARINNALSRGFSSHFQRNNPNKTNDIISQAKKKDIEGIWSHLSGGLQATRLDFSKIPLIDIDALRPVEFWDPKNETEISEKLQKSLSITAKEIHDACHNIGFFMVKNHGVSLSLLSKTLEESKKFFDLPLERKMEISCKDTPNRGYFQIGEENLGEKKIGDYKEGVDIARSISMEEWNQIEDIHKKKMCLPNRWPSNLPSFKETMQQYFDAMMKLCLRLSRGVALSLGINPHFFDDKIDKPMASLRLTHYPPQLEPVTDEFLGAGPHTDYGMMTIVATNAEGLEVRNRRNEWIKVPYIPNTFVVNLGDMMPRWTNDYYVSTPHRVINPATQTPVHRYSLPFFFEPNYDAKITAIEKCISADNPSKYESIVFGQHLINMYVKTYKKTSNIQ